MPNFDQTLCADVADMYCSADFGAEADEKVVFELLVPGVAKVPPLRQYLKVEKLLVRENSVTSTAPDTMLVELRVNDTARAMAWRTTATLTVSGPSF
jgi:hypothetical protein